MGAYTFWGLSGKSRSANLGRVLCTRFPMTHELFQVPL